MSKPSDYPVAYVFISWTDEHGKENVIRYVCAHDGVKQAADEAIRSIWGYDRERLQPTHRIRSIDVFENVHPRTLRYEPIVRRDFDLKEYP